MKLPLYIKISLRYLFSVKSNLLSFMTIVSIIGITLGVAALIVTLSVMNGFMFGLKSKLLETAPQIMILKADENFTTSEDVFNKLKKYPEVLDYQPFVYNQAILSKDSQVVPVYVRGVDPQKDLNFMNLKNKLILGEYNLSDNCVILGKDLAFMLSATVNDQLNLLSPVGRKTPLGYLPKIKPVRVCGIVDLGIYEYNSTFVATNIKFAQEFFDMKDNITGIQLKLRDPFKADVVKEKLEKDIQYPYVLKSWMDMNKSLFQALQLEKFAMFLVITLIVVVASFNIASLISTKSREKRKEIAILRTLGADRSFITKVFLFQGIFIGVIGSFIGTVLGLAIVFIGDTYKVVKLNPEVYLIDHLPLKISSLEVFIIFMASMFICFVSSIFPAITASKESISEVLRYE
ncbi:MAG: FtsX-like permease family protein [Sulfurihydrogenibium sp.]|uniref:ABC transporter permease n=1 Tax=Sulfurihydrogenibium sp. TaxID=2053621 RepID=UPI000CC4269D|nr:MAG: lipoprotein-releasing system transmembrane subunit LolC [Sulfurihydrogenibium sp.]PMP77994.1 MAG: lipoprotein-releasing system transmembrane subunit LolC [Sulfurihydrogenibium sp.]